ncbi:copper resistance protein NlpE [Rhodocytophaga rosea]|uniref:Copper resistance protein NlpE n=1 Tax=Rhodocytophaga rosea TaxID=2704465 RepID=A0A6C0GLY1_9BACT|nr:copper resistance protein NlpE N-terminal domain-containing protein [Rhodocytophaga rosea]QHT68947.1 copper resistance protein NlpE [Rhodocytophaga rosea]
MKYLCIFLITGVWLVGAVSHAGSKPILTTPVTFVGSTPADNSIRFVLGIAPNDQIDFIKWALNLHTDKASANTFELTITFGESQPNTTGFKNGGRISSFAGTYTISKSSHKPVKGEVYQLVSPKLSGGISLVILNENLLHLLNPDFTLMAGNGGWDYTLNRKEPVASSSSLPVLTAAAALITEKTKEVVFAGRTPCQEIAKAYNLPKNEDCFKLKWKLTLKRDSITFMPSTYQLSSNIDRSRIIEGKWAIIKGVEGNPDVVLYQLDPDKPNQSFYFLAGDQNVLFFLNKKKQLLTGNNKFSFTLSKSAEQKTPDQ